MQAPPGAEVEVLHVGAGWLPGVVVEVLPGDPWPVLVVRTGSVLCRVVACCAGVRLVATGSQEVQP